MPLGLYISVPFCRTKCSYCNFASDVFAAAKYDEYVARVCADMARAEAIAAAARASFVRDVDTLYLGGGTPTVLAAAQLERLFAGAREAFRIAPAAEVTVECAPGTLAPSTIDLLLRCGVNRVSLGVQSFADEEARAVGRLHTRAVVLEEVARLRAAGIADINIDLIAGLPHQTRDSWRRSLDDVLALGVPHVSVYMLEVDADSRLGTELLAGGTRYHAHFVPDEETTAELYELACARLAAAGVAQYEISNFARPGSESRHNLKYWTRQPYLGFGVDAHSMLPPDADLRRAGANAVRFAQPDSLEEFLRRDAFPASEVISPTAALEERFFLGLRLTRGVRLADVEAEFGAAPLAGLREVMAEIVRDELATLADGVLRLTPRGRLLSNEVFARFVALGAA